MASTPVQLTEKQQAFIQTHLGVDIRAKGLTDPPPGANRKQGKIAGRWQKTLTDLKGEIGLLQTSVKQHFPEQDAPGFAAAVDISIAQLVDGYQNRIRDTITAAEASGDPGYQNARQLIAKLRGEISTHPLIEALRVSDLCDGNGFENAFLLSLDDIEAELST